MSQQTINIGTVANDGTGDNARAGGTKINANFTELYTALGAVALILPTQTATQIPYNGSAGFKYSSSFTYDDVTDSLILGGAPSGAVSTDLLQVNGGALFGSLRVDSTAGEATLQNTNEGVALFFRTKNRTTNGSGGGIAFFAADGLGPAGHGGDINFQAGEGTGANAAGSVLAIAGSSVVQGGNFEFAAGDSTGVGGSAGVMFLYVGSDVGGGGTDGVFYFSDTSGSATMTYEPVPDLLTVGNLKFGTYTGGVVVQAGYITIKDFGGTTRRLLVG